MNLFSQGLFSQFVHFGGYDVLSLLTLIQPSSIFSLIVCMDKIYVSDEQFFPLSNHCYDNWKTALFLFPWQPLLGIQVLSSNHAAYESKLFLKELSQTNKVFPRKLSQRCILRPIIKVTSIRVKNASKIIFSNFYHY